MNRTAVWLDPAIHELHHAKWPQAEVAPVKSLAAAGDIDLALARLAAWMAGSSRP
jgi:hypothetical protein